MKNSELIKQLDVWIEGCKLQAKLFQKEGMTMSYINSDAMSIAYNNVKQLLNKPKNTNNS
jgi:hypothetical protein